MTSSFGARLRRQGLSGSNHTFSTTSALRPGIFGSLTHHSHVAIFDSDTGEWCLGVKTWSDNDDAPRFTMVGDGGAALPRYRAGGPCGGLLQADQPDHQRHRFGPD